MPPHNKVSTLIMPSSILLFLAETINSQKADFRQNDTCFHDNQDNLKQTRPSYVYIDNKQQATPQVRSILNLYGKC